MSLKTEKLLILKELDVIKTVFTSTVNLIPTFNITDSKILPYGLRAHTRSISWIVEQVITQQAKFHAEKLGIADVDFNMPDTCLHDCVIDFGEERYYVNIKIHNSEGRKNKNDISAVEKLYMQYTTNPNYRLIYACFGVRFQNLTISFDKESIHTFSPQFLPVYVNPRNDKIQAYYHHTEMYRTRKDFLRLLRENSRSIILE
jgi:hypothetical protein